MHEVVIDGTRYAPVTGENDKPPVIGVGITTRDRRDAFNKTLGEIKRLTSDAKIVVVDDASKVPAPEATYRFEKNAGIARAKNKCLELLQDCEHIFLFDDDVYPIAEDWWRPYVESPEPHLMWIYDKPDGTTKRQVEILYRDSRHVAYHSTRGAMLYVHRPVLDVVGGMDPEFGKWGWEHASWSDRIHAAGLTTWRYADVTDSGELIYSMDQHNEVRTTATIEAKRFSSGPGLELRMENRHSSRYIEYRDLADVIITTLFTKQVDPQRNKHMTADTKLLAALQQSLTGHQFVVLHDNLKSPTLGHAEFVQVETNINPYFQRHLSIYQYLRDHPEIGRVWCVDGTDVQMLRDPFPEMQPGRLYLGSEPSTLRNDWMLKHHPDSKIQKFFKANPNLPLLNAGLIGGDRHTVMAFLQAIVKEWFDDHIDFIFGWETQRVGVGDMGVLNVVARERFGDQLEHGPHVNTVFKAEEKTNTTAWFRHK